ncbi:methenyltetrahydromethanopterin cyclohydrolase [Moorella naiadis]|uniref:methenyltetrahydromethanopterin cyclohydrolase n=1 Tax=Moorella naiadis (nom. illeg.) TaxID=3093670 RepID=UPI003D9C98E5
MFSINAEAVRIVKEIIADSRQLNITVSRLANGATVIDMGVKARGGLMAGKRFIEATIGGIGEVGFGTFNIQDLVLPTVDVYIDQPAITCLAAQFSGWRITEARDSKQVAPLGSGPLRAIAQRDVFCRVVPYKDINHEAVLAIQSTELPDETVAEDAARACNISPENLYILVAATGSVAGAMQVVARSVEPAMWRLHVKGFDVSKVVCGLGSSPLPPVIRDEIRAMDRVNTSLLYGTSVTLFVDCTDGEVEEVINKLPLEASRLYGTPFMEIFKAGNYDFYEIDKDVHTVARFIINNIATGNTFSAGSIRPDMLAQSFFN